MKLLQTPEQLPATRRQRSEVSNDPPSMYSAQLGVSNRLLPTIYSATSNEVGVSNQPINQQSRQCLHIEHTTLLASCSDTENLRQVPNCPIEGKIGKNVHTVRTLQVILTGS